MDGSSQGALSGNTGTANAYLENTNAINHNVANNNNIDSKKQEQLGQEAKQLLTDMKNQIAEKTGYEANSPSVQLCANYQNTTGVPQEQAISDCRGFMGPENIEVMSNIVAEMRGIPAADREKPEVIREIHKETERLVERYAPQGVTNTEKMHEVVRVENTIEKAMPGGLDRIVQAALRDASKEIARDATQGLEKALGKIKIQEMEGLDKDAIAAFEGALRTDVEKRVNSGSEPKSLGAGSEKQ